MSNTAEAAATSSAVAANAQNNKNRTVAIVLGVVLGLLALAAIIGLLLFCLRRRRRQRAKESPRSISPDFVGGAAWRKEPLTNSSNVENTAPGRLSTSDRYPNPAAATVPLMAENAMHRNDGHGAIGNTAQDPYQGVSNSQPGMMSGTTAGYGSHHPGQNYIPLSSHSRSSAAAAGFGGAALGGLAAKQHHDKHDERDFARHSEDSRGYPRKPVGAPLGYGKNGSSPSSGVANNTTPGYQRRHSDSPHGDFKSPYEPVGTTGGMISRSPPTHGSPPAYNGTGNALSSHPPYGNNHRHSMDHEPLMAGAAGVGAGAVGGAAAARHQDGVRNRDSDSSLTGRRSWDAGRQPQPHSILANPAGGRRYTGSTNPYVPARDPKKARFSDEVISSSNRQSQSGNGHPRDLGPNNSYSKADHTGSPPLVSPISDGSPTSGSPRHNMPGGWHGSGEWDRTGRRASYGNENAGTPRSPGESGWYRGRYMGDARSVSGPALEPAPAPASEPADSGRSDPADSRFYAQKRASGELG